MDFIRAAIKACFYDYPRASVSKMMREGQYDQYCSRIADIAKWNTPEFTLSEQRLLSDIISEKWMKRSLGGNMEGSEMSRVFLMLNHFSDEVLNDGQEPTVRFENLLRWHQVSLPIGENLLTCAYLAEKDLQTGNTRTRFVWPDILHHDNEDLNRILDGGLSDIHAHLFATTDVFAENWVSLMNHVAFAERRKGVVGIVEFHRAQQEGDTDYWDDQDMLTLHQWGIVAAAIRAQLAGYLYQGLRFDAKEIVRMIGSATQCIGRVADIKGMISDLSDDSLRMADEQVIDYAINKKDVRGISKEDLKSPYMLHVGERRLLYGFFRRYYDQDAVAIDIAPFVYLYTLIKSKYRREIVQTNPLTGFENFKNYQDEKGLFSQYHATIAYKYAVQTAVGEKGNDSLEARVSSKAVNQLRHLDYKHSLFGEGDYFDRDVSENFSLVVHFLKTKEKKKGDSSYRHYILRKSLHKQMSEVILNAQRNGYAHERKAPLLVGIDAAGGELNCRPEVFAPYFRWARLKGLSNITFHAGEDFYDIIDGLRSIDETILFMEYERGCRIGHGLALGVDAKKYYANRHYRAVMPKQYMLDNCVWLLYKSKEQGAALHSDTVAFLENTIHSLLNEIGYGEGLDIYYYWQSMLLRGDARNLDGVTPLPAFIQSSVCKNKQCEQARKYELAKELHERYETDERIKARGTTPDYYRYPHSIFHDVAQLQEKMLTEIEKRGICIECNPSSNLKIGPFDRYDELPVTRFFSVKEPYQHRINVSINTDDRGVFATSIHNEYSLVAAAMSKVMDEEGERIYTDEEIYNYLSRIMQNGTNQRFGVPKMRVY